MIILWLPNSGLIRTIVTIHDVEIEINTSRDYYYLGENFTANAYLVNTHSWDVWMEPINAIPFSGLSHLDPVLAEVHLLEMDGRLHIPAKSKVFLIDRLCTPKKAGEYKIHCRGKRKTVVIIESKSENETVNAVMNQHSFMNTDKATLYIANVGINYITFGFEYYIKKYVNGLWEEVSLFPSPSAWPAVLYGLETGNVFHQIIQIYSLEAGQYRISKKVFDEVTQESITLFDEFEIFG